MFFNISRDLAIAITYDDFSGTEENQINQWDKFFTQNNLGYLYFNFEEVVWEKCAVSGLYGDCVECTDELSLTDHWQAKEQA